MILDLLASGALSLTSIRLLARHLTAENHQAVLAKAGNRSLREIEALVAELAPRPDVPSTVRKLPGPKAASAPAAGPVPAMRQATIVPPPSAPQAMPRPTVQALAPDRYLVRFTIGPEANERLRRIQTLLRREIPDGDPGAIFERRPDAAAREGGEDEAGGGRQAAARPGYPSRDG